MASRKQFRSLDELEAATSGLRDATNAAVERGLQSLPGVLSLPLDPPSEPEAKPEAESEGSDDG